jgi:PAS domain S-box-containing protein
LAIVVLIEAKHRAEESRRQAAAQVEKSESYLAEAERLGHIGSWASNALKNPPELTYLSAEMFRILGLPPGDVPPSTVEAGQVFTAADPENWRRIMGLFEAARREKIADGEFPAVLPDGSRRMIRIVAHGVPDAAGTVAEFVGTCIDVTDQHRARTELEKAFEEIGKSENQLRAIIDTIPAFAWSARPDGSADFFNQLYLDYAGLSAEQAMDWGWTASVHPEDLNSLADYWRSILASGEAGEVEARLRRLDGVYRWFLFRASPLRGHPARNNEGGVTRWYGLLIDIDDRKNMEEALRSTEARLSRATQIATVGELAASIAHEINQPLAAVVASGHACLRFLSAQPPSMAKAYEAAESIVRDGKEAGEVVRRIRALFKRAAAERVVLNLNDVINEVLHLLGGETAKRRVAVEMDLGNDLPLVVGDRVQLQQLVLNLLLNGIEAMDPVHDRPRKLFVRSKQESPETVLVEVRDYGVGLENPDKIFEAFVTTKENGMGMGLTICRSIVEAHNGRLWAASGDGPGATFCFALPLNHER